MANRRGGYILGKAAHACGAGAKSTRRRLRLAPHDRANTILRPILTFEPGLYAIDLHATPSGTTESGLTLPCARFDPVDAGAGRATAVALSPGGWVSATDGTMFLRVQNDTTDIVLTTYRLTGHTPALDLKIRAIRSIGAVELASTPPLRPDPPAQPDAPNLTQATMTILAHVERHGDVRVGPGEWAGAASKDCAVEGFSIHTHNALAGVTLEYQAILGEQWQTPWFPTGTFCGSRGMSLPILGFRLRIVGPAADRYMCRYSGVFLGGDQVGPLSDGQACESAAQALVAMTVDIADKTQDVATSGPRIGSKQKDQLFRKVRGSRLAKTTG